MNAMSSSSNPWEGATMPTVDSQHLRRVLGHYPTGVAVITAMVDEEPIGMVVGSFSSVSLDPPLVSFMPDKASSTYARLAGATAFCVNVLAADQEHLCRQFASKTGDKFRGVSTRPAPSGAPIIDGTVAWIDCSVHAVMDAGDHDIVLGRVGQFDIGTPGSPLLFFQGGYGGFSSRTLVAPYAVDLGRHLQIADVAREPMERLAAELKMDCYLQATVGDDIVIVAGIGHRESSVRQHVGRRLPFVPPYGTLFISDRGDAARNAWLSRLGVTLSAEDHEMYDAMLARVRERGWSLGLLAPRHDQVWAELERFSGPHGADEVAGRLADLMAELREQYEPAEVDPATRHDVRILGVPILDATGEVVQVMALFGMPLQATAGEVEHWRARLQETAGIVSREIQQQVV